MKRRFLAALAALAAAAGILALTGCSAEADLTDYVSEYRSNLYEGTQGTYSVFAAYSEREYPYRADGNVGDMTTLFEVALTAADNTKTYRIAFTSGGKEYTAELSFDSVRMAHRWSQSIPEPTETQIAFTISDADDAEAEHVTVTAESRRSADVLPLGELIARVRSAEQARFDALTNGKDFAGELYVRLLYNDGGCLYYVGLTDRTGKTYAMLTDAATGELLATHEG